MWGWRAGSGFEASCAVDDLGAGRGYGRVTSAVSGGPGLVCSGSGLEGISRVAVSGQAVWQGGTMGGALGPLRGRGIPRPSPLGMPGRGVDGGAPGLRQGGFFVVPQQVGFVCLACAVWVGCEDGGLVSGSQWHLVVCGSWWDGGGLGLDWATLCCSGRRLWLGTGAAGILVPLRWCGMSLTRIGQGGGGVEVVHCLPRGVWLYPPPPCNSYAFVIATVGAGTVLIWYLILIRYKCSAAA